ncbi:MAG: DMT family transporter [Candidatus Hodarchaeales archaeon]|jgi:drug/metabolite transporter (DMT)-like permease
MNSNFNKSDIKEKDNNKYNTFFSPNRRFGIILSFFSLFLLGVLPIISNSRPQELDALNYTLYLSLWQLICSIPLVTFELNSSSKGLFSKTVPTDLKKKVLRIMFVTGLIFLVATFLYVLSFEKAGTINAAIAMQAYPLFSILWETIFLNKKKNKQELGFTLILIIGIVYLGTNGTWQLENLSIWFILALSVPLLWSIAHVTIKNTLDNSPITPGQVTFIRVLIASVFLFFIAVFTNGSESVVEGLFTFSFQIFAFLMGLVFYLELVNWFYAVKHVDVSVASSITTPTPVVTMVLAILLLGESIEVYQLITMVVVFISLYGLLYYGKEAKKQLLSHH